MTLPTANIIRTMRRENNVTQDELAQALGVSYQAVSRWENGQAYPDIELLPKIAAFFGITTDRLLGADEEAKLRKRIETLEAYNRAYHAAEDGYAKYEIMARAVKEFPDSEPFMEKALEQLICHDALPREEALPIVREYCRKLIENTRSSVRRLSSLYRIFQYEDEDRLTDWSKYVSEKVTVPQLLASRYNHLGEVEKCNLQRQKNLFASLNYSFDTEFSRLRYHEGAGSLNSDTASRAADHLLGPAEKDPTISVKGQEIILRLVDVLRDPAIEEDGWIFRRAFTYLRLAAGRFGSGDKEGGYEALEKSVELYETVLRIPVDRDLPLNCQVLDRLTISAISYYNPEQNLLRQISSDPVDIMLRRDAASVLPVNTHNFRYAQIYHPLTDPSGWEWFNCVRDEDRYKACVERIRKYRPEDFPE
ncbi:MAG: helix-turn-helix transcriptional regulator [Clostridia bacterium]|nr:helix-turn-helix transcriptional regulator [Clostridia bacterium]